MKELEIGEYYETSLLKIVQIQSVMLLNNALAIYAVVLADANSDVVKYNSDGSPEDSSSNHFGYIRKKLEVTSKNGLLRLDAGDTKEKPEMSNKNSTITDRDVYHGAIRLFSQFGNGHSTSDMNNAVTLAKKMKKLVESRE